MVYITNPNTAQLSTFPHNMATNSVTVTGLNPDTTYNMQVQAINLIGSGQKTGAIAVKTLPLTAPTAPNAPFLDVLGNQLYVDWEEPYDGGSTITNYNVMFQSQGGQWTPYSRCQPGASTSCSFNFE